MEKLTADEGNRLRELRERLRVLRLSQRGEHSPEEESRIRHDISGTELEIDMIQERPLIRERQKAVERRFEVWNIARAKAAGRPLGERWEKEWEEYLPEAAEEGWLERYGPQVDLWLLELGQKNRAVPENSS